MNAEERDRRTIKRMLEAPGRRGVAYSSATLREVVEECKRTRVLPMLEPEQLRKMLYERGLRDQQTT